MFSVDQRCSQPTDSGGAHVGLPPQISEDEWKKQGYLEEEFSEFDSNKVPPACGCVLTNRRSHAQLPRP